MMPHEDLIYKIGLEMIKPKKTITQIFLHSDFCVQFSVREPLSKINVRELCSI